jgi:putative SOS response-associated peptidase YedK
MCSRYRRTTSEEEIAPQCHIPIPSELDLPLRAPTITPKPYVLAIRFNPETTQRTLCAVRWGLIPHWAKDPKIAYQAINSRVETVETTPSYRQAFKKGRCLLPVVTFYEWSRTGGGIPFAIG